VCWLADAARPTILLAYASAAERHVREAPVRKPHVGDAGHVQPAGGVGREPAPGQVHAPAPASGRPRGHGNPATANTLDAQRTHHLEYLVAADAAPTLASQLHERLSVAVHGHEPMRMDRHDVTGQGLVPRPHPRAGTHLELPVSTGREEPAIQRSPQGPADGPDPEPAAMRVDIRDHQCRVDSSRCLRKKPTPNSRSRCCGAAPRSPDATVSTLRTHPDPPYPSYRPVAVSTAVTR
jgi:hypothetical protein